MRGLHDVHRRSDADVITELLRLVERGRLSLLPTEVVRQLAAERLAQLTRTLEPEPPSPESPSAVLRPQASPTKQQETQEIDLEYTYADGAGVVGAAYHVRSDAFNADGTLDGSGKAHLTGVPMAVTSFRYWFDADPMAFVAEIQPSVSTALADVRAGALEALDSTGEWIWGTVQGDFNENQTTSQLVVNTILGLIPIVDQALDIRDLIAGSTSLLQFYSSDDEQQHSKPDVLGLSHETWLWLSLFLIALGAIPILGSVIKGVFKGLIKKLKDLGGAASSLSPRQLREVWEELVGILNHFGKGNAQRWLKEATSKLSGWLDDAALKIRGAFDVIGQKLEALADLAGRLPGDTAKSLAARLGEVRQALRTAYRRLDAKKAEINAWLGEQLERVLGGRHTFEVDGVPGGTARRTQRAGAGPDLEAIPMGASSGGPLRRLVPARDRLAALSEGELEQVRKVETFTTQGVSAQEAARFLTSTPDGQALLRQMAEASPDTDSKKLFERALGYVQSGTQPPLRESSPGALVKIVPEGQGVSSYSPFFTTPEQLEGAVRSGRPLSDVFGLPAASDAARYDVYEIHPVGDAEVLRSTIAPTEELGGKLTTQGGAEQIIVPNRRQFSEPKKLRTIMDNETVRE